MDIVAERRGLRWDADTHRWTRREALAVATAAVAVATAPASVQAEPVRDDPLAWNPATHSFTPVNASLYDAADAGVTFDGVTDDYAKWHALITSIGTAQAEITTVPGNSVIGTNLTVPANIAINYVNGATLAPKSGVAVTHNGLAKAGPYQIFGGAGTVALGPGAPRRIYPEWAGAKADNSTDNATPFAAWKALIPARGGRGELQQGVYRTSGTLLLPSYLTMEGVPGSGFNNIGTADALSGSCLYWIGGAGGTILSFFDTTLAKIRGVHLNGAGVASVVGALIDSDNNPAAKYASLEDFEIVNCGVANTNGYGVRVGTSVVNGYQADTWTVRRGTIAQCWRGVSIWSYNAGYQGKIELVYFRFCQRAIEVVLSGNVHIDRCEFGHDANSVADIWEGTDGAGHGGTGSPCLITNCQTEGNPSGTTQFLLIDATCTAQTQQIYTLINNQITDCGILVNASRHLVLIGNNFYGCNVQVGAAAGGTIIHDHGSTFNGTGVRHVTDAAITNGSTTLTSATAAFVAGDVGKRIVPNGSGSLGLSWAGIAGIPDGTTIVSVTNGTTAVMSQAATATSSGIAAQFDYGYVLLNTTTTVKQDRPYGGAAAGSGAFPGQYGNITVGASPFTYTAGESQEAVYIAGGTVTGVARNGGNNVFSTTNVTVYLNPRETVTVTYSVAPVMSADRK